MNDLDTVTGELDEILGATYTDPGTVRRFQAGVVQWVRDNANRPMAKDPALRLGARTWPPDAREYARIVDGVLGPNTRRAAAFVNKYLVLTQPNNLGDAIADETLAVLPMTIVPPASAADSAEMRQQAARTGAAQALAAQTPAELRAAAAQVRDAASKSPPEVQAEVSQAAAQAQAAQTPAEVRQAAEKIQVAAAKVIVSPGGSILDALRKPYGPLPLGGWIAAALAFAGVSYLAFRR